MWQEDLRQTPGPGYEERSAAVASLFLDTETEGPRVSPGPEAGGQDCKWPVWSGGLLITWIINMPSKGTTQSLATKKTNSKELQGRSRSQP